MHPAMNRRPAGLGMSRDDDPGHYELTILFSKHGQWLHLRVNDMSGRVHPLDSVRCQVPRQTRVRETFLNRAGSFIGLSNCLI